MICSGSASLVFAGAMKPAGEGGITKPKPIPYKVIVSPGLAGRETTPDIEPAGATYVPSGRSAVTYCFPLTTNDGGASSPGCTLFTITLYGLLEIPLLVTTISTLPPVGMSDGT